MSERTPALAHCRTCGHVWAAAWLPINMTEASRLMKAGCPACGERSLVYMATAEQTETWRNGPRGEPCFVPTGEGA
ncbi:hypothetical protein [Bosea sp. (in: a-proteobacteria)]|uniref:hypothetical protein n=1 Tax=Bosea sp. (in: a-proteobacteria) TaxID=1871050 RepID=UPI003B3B15F0